MPKPKRKQLLLPGAFQTRFIVTSFLYQVVIVVVFVSALFLPSVLRIDDTAISPEEAWQTGIELLALHNHVWPALAIACVLMLMHALVFSHRIAGPLSRFGHIFKEVGNGNLLVSAKIRRRDLLPHEAECLGEMVRALHGKIAALQQHRTELSTHIDRLARIVEKTPSKPVQAEVAQLRRELDQMTQALADFRTSYNLPDKVRSAPSSVKIAA